MKKLVMFFVVSLVSISAFASDTDVLVVTMGGRTSCGSGGPTGMGMYAPTKSLLQDLQVSYADRKIHYVISCLDTSPPPSGRAQFFTSRLPGKLYSGNTMDIAKEIETLVRTRAIGAVFLTGHSYGGWMAMYLATKLAKEVPIHGLYTVDPISPRCGPSQVIFGGEDCKQAPREFDNRAILARVNQWENFFQNQDTWLQSSEIPEASNHHIKYRGPHTSIDSDARTWEVIHASVYHQVK